MNHFSNKNNCLNIWTFSGNTILMQKIIVQNIINITDLLEQKNNELKQ